MENLEKLSDYELCKKVHDITNVVGFDITGFNNIMLYYYGALKDAIRLTDLRISEKVEKQMFDKILNIHKFNTCNNDISYDNIVTLVVDYWDSVCNMSLEEISQYLDSGDFSPLNDKNPNYVQLLLNSTEDLFSNMKERIRTIDLLDENGKYEYPLQEVFVINEFIKFLKNELERTKVIGYEIKTDVTLDDYEIIVNNVENIVDRILDMYWNTDLGTSYQDYGYYLKGIVEEIKNCQEWEKEQGQTD